MEDREAINRPGEAGRTPETSAETLEEILSVFREAFEMDVAFVAEFVGDREVFSALEGDAGCFGLEEGGSLPLEGSFCKRVIEGKIPNAIPDARADERTRDLDITREAGVGSYVGFPLRLSDGRLYGTLCCVSHTADPWLRDRDLRLVGDLARKATERLERDGMI